MDLILNTVSAERYVSPEKLAGELERACCLYRSLMVIGEGHPYWSSLGWLDCAEAACQMDVIEAKAKEIREQAEIFLLVGVGGSNQAARAMIEAMPRNGGPKIIYAGNTLSARSVQRILKQIEGRSVYMNVIAKNFETLEPGSHYRILRQAMEKQYTPEEMAKRVILTGTRGSRLEEISRENNCTFLCFPERVGGRYTAFTPVGLLPLAVAGFDLKVYLQGGLDMQKALRAEDGGIAARYAALRWCLYEQGFGVEMLSAFEPDLYYAQSWWKQLFGESEGKDRKGLMPAFMTNSEDLHSMGQYMQDGKRFVIETFLTADDPEASVLVQPDRDFDDRFDYLDGMDFADINRAAEQATMKAHDAGGVPCIQLRMPRLDEYSFGQMYYFFMMSCAISGQLLGVNPFDQEGVEEYKRSMFAALGKPQTLRKPSCDRPMQLAHNRVDYLLPGGGMIDGFLNLEHGKASQLWIASTVQSVLPGAADSRSRLRPEDGGEVLADVLAGNPEGYLGKAHAAIYGPHPGILLKLLNSQDRLLVQTHPDDRRAQKYFHSPFGKSEGWYVLDVDDQQPAYVWAGFKPWVTPEMFCGLIETQDCHGILSCLHRFRIQPGDVIYIPAGMPHALGSGSLVAEIQQPTDITLRAERFRPDGSELPEESLHAGVGMDGLMDCFDFSWAMDEETVRSRCFVKLHPRQVPGGEICQLLGPEQTPCFTFTRIRCQGELERDNRPFRVLLTEKGNGYVEAGGEKLRVTRGSEVFLPAGISSYRISSREGVTILECTPPAADAFR